MPQVPPNPGPAGFFQSTLELLRAGHEYVLVRCEIAGIEAKSVFQRIFQALLIAVVCLLCLGAGFIYLSLSLIYVLAEVVGWGWGWALLVSGLTLLIVMIGGLFWGRSILKGQWFPVTLTELKKDSAWLSQKTTPNA